MIPCYQTAFPFYRSAVHARLDVGRLWVVSELTPAIPAVVWRRLQQSIIYGQATPREWKD